MCLFLIPYLVNAQDIITKVNGDEIKAKVREIGLDEVTYNRYDNLTGSLYSLKKTEIFMITYPDGSKDIFGRQQIEPKAVAARQIPQDTVSVSSLPVIELANVKKGDIVNINGQKAIVFQTYGGGHGKAMAVVALQNTKDAWSTTQEINKLHTTNPDNGRANTEAVLQFIRDNGLDINDFPAVAWCKQLGEGWYIPAMKEMETFVNWWLGNDVELNWDDENPEEHAATSETSFSTKINKKLRDAGGTPFRSGTFTSTENKNGKLFTFQYDGSKGYWHFTNVSKTNVKTWHSARAFFEY